MHAGPTVIWPAFAQLQICLGFGLLLNSVPSRAHPRRPGPRERLNPGFVALGQQLRLGRWHHLRNWSKIFFPNFQPRPWPASSRSTSLTFSVFTSAHASASSPPLSLLPERALVATPSDSTTMA